MRFGSHFNLEVPQYLKCRRIHFGQDSGSLHRRRQTCFPHQKGDSKKGLLCFACHCGSTRVRWDQRRKRRGS